MIRLVRKLCVWTLAIATTMAMVFAFASLPALAATTPVIQAVSLTGNPGAPVITIYGSGFGTLPANTGQPVPFTGFDYGNQLGFSDLTSNWNAGQSGNGIGITVNQYTNSTIQFGFGSYYQTGGFSLATGDSFKVSVQGVSCTGTVGYPTTLPHRGR